jgi:hypothetical protein
VEAGITKSLPEIVPEIIFVLPQLSSMVTNAVPLKHAKPQVFKKAFLSMVTMISKK